MKKISYIFIILVFFFIACNKEKNDEAPKDFPKLEFKLDKSLLDEKITDTSINLSFSPPKNWKPLSTTINQNNKIYTLFEPFTHITSTYTNIFFNEKDSSVLTYFSIKNIKDITPEKVYDSLFNITNNSDKIKKSKFYKDNLLITQYLIQVEPIIIFKLIFNIKENTIAEFNYIIKKEKYSEEIAKSIEASIASINYNK